MTCTPPVNKVKMKNHPSKDYQQPINPLLANSLLTLCSQNVSWQSADKQPTVCQLSVICWGAVGRLLTSKFLSWKYCKYSPLPVTWTFRENGKRFELSGVPFTSSWLVKIEKNAKNYLHFKEGGKAWWNLNNSELHWHIFCNVTKEEYSTASK